MIKIVVTPGCPSGVGPELLVKSFAQIKNPCCIYWSGGPQLLERSARISQVVIYNDKKCEYRLINSPATQIVCLDINEEELPLPGFPTDRACEMQRQFLLDGIELVKAKAAQAIVTGPVRKKALMKVDGTYYPGQTELLAHHFAIDEQPALMCFSGLPFILGLATVHIPLKEISTDLTTQVVRNALSRLSEAARWHHGLSANKTRITVLGLNPHASENGLLGCEETERIIPVINEFRNSGIAISGPIAADGFFGSYRYLSDQERPHAVLAMYHDQGLAPYKALCADSVNFTWGLTILRTSPGHGTADDLAGKNIASAESTAQALSMAIKFCQLPSVA